MPAASAQPRMRACLAPPPLLRTQPSLPGTHAHRLDWRSVLSAWFPPSEAWWRQGCGRQAFSSSYSSCSSSLFPLLGATSSSHQQQRVVLWYLKAGIIFLNFEKISDSFCLYRSKKRGPPSEQILKRVQYCIVNYRHNIVQ